MGKTYPGEFRWRAPNKPASTASNVIRKMFRALEEKKITIAELADELEYSKAAVHHWKVGRSYPTILTIEFICAKYELEITI